MSTKQHTLRRKDTFVSDNSSRRGSGSSGDSNTTDVTIPSEYQKGPRDSTDTYCSTDNEEDYEENYYVVDDSLDYFNCYQPPPCDAIAATPPVFANLFPSTRRLIIKHDDSSIDGNMNLRVDCNASLPGDHREHLVTLFYMRMYDLRTCEWSLRRYGRECGREVAKIKRKFAVKPSLERRPALQRSMSKAMESMRSPKSSKPLALNRTDSGFSSSFDEDSDEEEFTPKAQPGVSSPTNTLIMEFSNYAHVGLKRSGGQANKKYEFEYWGKKYQWKRSSKRSANGEEISYHLLNTATNSIVAHIVPEQRSTEAAQKDAARGGFVPPSSMWLVDSPHDPISSTSCDVADVIVATGLSAFIDDCIKRKFGKSKRVVQMVIPMTPIKMNMEYIGPKKLVDELFNRRNSPSPKPGALKRNSSYNSQQASPRPGMVSRETSYSNQRPSMLSRETSYSSRNRAPIRGAA